MSLWIARNEKDSKIKIYSGKPIKSKRYKVFYETWPVVGISVQLPKGWFPEIKPGECRKIYGGVLCISNKESY